MYYKILKYNNLTGPPLYMRSVVDRNVIMRRMTSVSFILLLVDKDSENASVLRRCVCANQPIYFVTQNVTSQPYCNK
jgi:hypothetical protein